MTAELVGWPIPADENMGRGEVVNLDSRFMPIKIKMLADKFFYDGKEERWAQCAVSSRGVCAASFFTSTDAGGR